MGTKKLLLKKKRAASAPQPNKFHIVSIYALPNGLLKKLMKYDRNSGGAFNICIRTIKWIPVLFIFSVVVWSYYAYVWQLCISTISSHIERVLYLIVYHVVLLIFVWAWRQTIFTPVGEVPHKFKLSREDVERLHNASSEQAQRHILECYAQSLPITNRTITGMVRYCDKCFHIKPDRAHHCSVCGTCVLKMDHHCPWVNNCVSFTNYKYFILFLAYSFLYCFFIMITTLHYFILIWKSEIDGGAAKFNILFLFFVSTMFATSLISLFLYHCYLVAKNRSTLEAFRAPIFRTGPDKNGFNLGKIKNFKQVFGENKLLWLLPIPTSCGDGLSFPTRTDFQQGYDTISQPNNSSGDGVTFDQKQVDQASQRLLTSQNNWEEDDLNSVATNS